MLAISFHRLHRLLPTAVLGLCLGVQTAAAGPLMDAAMQAEALAAGGDARAAHAKMQEAFGDFAATLPLTVSLAEFATDKPAAYGSYTPRPDTVFKPGEPLITYLELIGLTWETLPDKRYTSAFNVDLELIDYKGDTLAAQKKFGSFSFTGRFRNQEIYTHLTLDVTGAPAGDYKVRYTVNDTVGKRSTSFEQKFSIAKE
ncbi:hypothetical protein [Ciceribacter sp. L1K22]|uniref:hypothetical protein n=1 Tax=Ciceribacter sp. L1K22 TaxID=2820275 RepID=UPI001ABDBF57|nr:hypothetical protein [Ciceribacter sp. L1K22]MBO3759996.1 hypothetical protein [Ciceribacter sp. L1K22]